jgi:hypothetical protein
MLIDTSSPSLLVHVTEKVGWVVLFLLHHVLVVLQGPTRSLLPTF